MVKVFFSLYPKWVASRTNIQQLEYRTKNVDTHIGRNELLSNISIPVFWIVASILFVLFTFVYCVENRTNKPLNTIFQTHTFVSLKCSALIENDVGLLQCFGITRKKTPLIMHNIYAFLLSKYFNTWSCRASVFVFHFCKVIRIEGKVFIIQLGSTI